MIRKKLETAGCRCEKGIKVEFSPEKDAPLAGKYEVKCSACAKIVYLTMEEAFKLAEEAKHRRVFPVPGLRKPLN